MEHSFPLIQVKTKKKVFYKNRTLFSPNSGGHLRSGAHQSRIIGGDADVDHTQTIGVDAVKLLGEINPPIPSGFGHPCLRSYIVKTNRFIIKRFPHYFQDSM